MNVYTVCKCMRELGLLRVRLSKSDTGKASAQISTIMILRLIAGVQRTLKTEPYNVLVKAKGQKGIQMNMDDM